MPKDYFKLQQSLNEKRYSYTTFDAISGEKSKAEIDADNPEELEAHVKNVSPTSGLMSFKGPERRARVGNETNPRFGGKPFNFMAMLKQKFASVKDDVYKGVLGRLGGDVGLKYAETQLATRGERTYMANAAKEQERIQQEIDDLNTKFGEAGDDKQREKIIKEIQAREGRLAKLSDRIERANKMAETKAKKVSISAAKKESQSDDTLSVAGLSKALKKRRKTTSTGERVTKKDLEAAVRDAVAAERSSAKTSMSDEELMGELDRRTKPKTP